MIITTTIRVEVKRSDGRITEVAETMEFDVGDNPLFEVHEVARTITATSGSVLDCINAGRNDQLPKMSLS